MYKLLHPTINKYAYLGVHLAVF